MSRTAGATCDILLTRIRQTGGLAVDKDFAMSILSYCQRIVNAGLQRVLTTAAFIPTLNTTLYRYRETLTSAIDIITIKEGARELKRIDNINDFASYDPNWFTATGSRFEAWMQLGRDVLILYPSMTTLITNGDMELDSNWADYNTPVTNERSSTQVYTGTYSRKLVSNSYQDGIQSDPFTTITGEKYSGAFRLYPVDYTHGCRIYVSKGDASGGAYSGWDATPTMGQWNEVTFNYTETAGGSAAFIALMDPHEASTGYTWYFDNVTVVPTVDIVSSKLTTSFNNYTTDYNTALELPGEDVEIMLSLAEITLLIRYKQFSEAIGRIKQFKTEFAKYFGVFK